MKRITTLVAVFLMTASIWAQSPEKMSYQAVVRDASNTLVTSQSVGMQISILQGSASGTAVYEETQTPTTNTNGLVSLEIGAGTIVSGDFSTIDWSADTYFIQTETDPTGGSNYTITGTSQLLSVPYALHSKTAESITGTINYTETDPIYTAWDKSTGISITESQISDLTHTVDTDTHLDEAAVDNFVANNGYLTAEVDGSVTNEIELPTGGTNGQVLKTDGTGNYAWVDQTVDTDSDTQLDEADVDNFVANNGYLTAEVDGSVTNEIQSLIVSQTGDTLTISGGNSVLVPGISSLNFPKVGDYRDGGVIFYVDPSNPTQGLICSMEDLGFGTWYNGSYSVTGATGTAIGTGLANTTAITLDQGASTYAASICEDLISEGMSDWYLPSLDELTQIYLNRTTVNATITANGGDNINNDSYWSSSEINSTNAFLFNFVIGNPQGNFTKNGVFKIRAIRAF